METLMEEEETEAEVAVEATEVVIEVTAEAETTEEEEEALEVEEAEVASEEAWEEINLSRAQFVSKLSKYYLVNKSFTIVKDDDLVSLKMKGLPYSTTFEEVADFFKDF